jgi:hypothetical protein
MACETQAAIIEVGDVEQELRMGGVDGRVSRYGRHHHWQPQPRRLGRLQLH